MKPLILALLVNTVLTAADSYAGYPGRWVVAEVTAYHRPEGRTAYGDDTRLEKHHYGIAAPQARDGVASWNTLPPGTLVAVPRGNGYLDGDADRHDPEQRVFPVDDDVPIITDRAKASGKLHLGLRVRSKQAAAAFGTKRMRVFVVDWEAGHVDRRVPARSAADAGAVVDVGGER